MVNFNSGYTAPGVYVNADTSPVASAVGVSSTVVCLVGPGLGYQTHTEQVTFDSQTSVVTLAQQGILTGSIVAPIVTKPLPNDAPNPPNYQQGTNYNVAQDGSGTTATTTLSLPTSDSSDFAVPTGTPITVTYNYANSNYYSLNQFTSLPSLINVYGNPFNNTTGTIQSPLSLAAQIAFQNGANILYTVALNGLGSISDQYNAAFDQTATNFNIDLLVPVYAAGQFTDLDSFNPFIAGLMGHLQSTANDGTPRVAIVGLPEDFDSSVTPDEIAPLYSYNRVCLVWPNKLNYYNSILNATISVGGSNLAAACAGLLANLPMNQGLTRRQINSLNSIDPVVAQTMTQTNKDIWSAGGTSVLEPNRINQLVIRHGVTTDPSSVITRELSIVRCQDALFLLLQQSLDQASLIGTPITSNTSLAVKGIIAGALETSLSQNIIQAYSGLTVVQQQLPNGDPTVIECSFAYQPTYPLNYITVTFSIDLSTGNLTTTTDTAGSSASFASNG